MIWANIGITVLTVAAFAFSAAGLLGARRHTAAGVARMVREREFRERVRAESQAIPGGMSSEEWAARHAEEGLEPVTYDSIDVGREFLAERVVKELDSATRSDAVLVGIGLVCGLAASVWSIWLP